MMKPMMKPKMRFKTFFAITALAIAIPSTIYAAVGPDDGPPACDHRGMHGKDHAGLPPFFKELNLTETQKSQLKTIMENEKPEKKAQWEQRRELMKKMHEVANTEQFDNSKAEQIADQIAALEKQEALARAQKGHEIFAILTPEQRTKMQDIMQKRMEKHEEKRGEKTSFQHSQFQGKPENNGLTTM